ncbi:hypothetical protein JTB14_014007, partial [Gonioctena quinquepunctata]
LFDMREILYRLVTIPMGNNRVVSTGKVERVGPASPIKKLWNTCNLKSCEGKTKINMGTPSDSPVEEVMFEIEPSRVPKPIPVALEDLCRLTKFTRQEIRIMYRGFKTANIGKINHLKRTSL